MPIKKLLWTALRFPPVALAFLGAAMVFVLVYCFGGIYAGVKEAIVASGAIEGNTGDAFRQQERFLKWSREWMRKIWNGWTDGR